MRKKWISTIRSPSISNDPRKSIRINQRDPRFVFRTAEVLLRHLRGRQLHVRDRWLLFRQYEPGERCRHVCSQVMYLHVWIFHVDEYTTRFIHSRSPQTSLFLTIHLSVAGELVADRTKHSIGTDELPVTGKSYPIHPPAHLVCTPPILSHRSASSFDLSISSATPYIDRTLCVSRIIGHDREIIDAGAVDLGAIRKSRSSLKRQ